MILNAFASQAYIVISALNVVQRSKHCFLAKLWHKNDVFDEKRCMGTGWPKRVAQHHPETAMLTLPREI